MNVKKTGGEFKTFHWFICNNAHYYVPYDMNDKAKAMHDEDLLLSIIHGDQMNVYEYDLSHLDEEIDIDLEENREMLEDHGHINHINYFEEENRKKRAYMKYLPNRDYNNDYGREQLKNPMGDDGTFIDNGYR
jgi:hypothetical protein